MIGRVLRNLGLVLAVALFGHTIDLGAATFVVTTISDSGVGSFREAIKSANATPGRDLITFHVPDSGIFTPRIQSIRLLSPLPAITDPVVIDATTQEGYDTTPVVELLGVSAGTGFGVNGLVVAADDSTIRGLAINRFAQEGIVLDKGSKRNSIEQCAIGTDADGTLARGNGGHGIFIDNSSDNRIGDLLIPKSRNIISGNGLGGIEILNGSRNVVRGNLIGTDASGSVALGNDGDGVVVTGLNAYGNVIGGLSPLWRNVISGNRGNGIRVGGGEQSTGHTTLIQGNYIGTDQTGAADLHNVEDGINLSASENTVVGGTDQQAPNLIAYNGRAGVYIASEIGGDQVLSNRILLNGRLGIDINPLGVTYVPVVLSSVLTDGVMTFIRGTLTAAPSTAFRIEYFSNSMCDPSGYGQGETLIGSAVVVTSSAGKTSVDLTLPTSIPPGTFITTTATSPQVTSEFSSCVAVAQAPPSADLGVTKTAPMTVVPLGSNVTFTITATNYGPNRATLVKTQDLIPAGTTFVSVKSTQGTCGSASGIVYCELGTIEVGATLNIAVVLQTTSRGSIANTVTIAGAELDPKLLNNSATAEIRVLGLEADFAFTPGAPGVGTVVSFTDLSIGSPTSWSWQFGDGSSSTAENPTHAFAAAGAYNVKLDVFNSASAATVTHTVYVSLNGRRRAARHSAP